MLKILTYLIATTCIALLGIFVFPIKEKDRLTFAELLKSSNPDVGGPLVSCSQQKREGVCKHIWYQDESPLYFRIESAESELFFFRDETTLEVLEQLTNVHCLMQEELYYETDKPMQRVRYLEAEKASYNYNTQLFVAEDVKIWKYALEGHTPPMQIGESDPLMRATAKSVEFTLKGEKLDFVAHQMKATLNTQDRSL